ncbi:MAG: chromosome segregation protein SMC [Methanoregulaceae archaeon]|nr:chromosome segregation protein SMC [Methanoregulaceae archaeon]
MHITELEIDNFKSFVKKTRIPFFEGFSVISGPNGSGKSNIIDSILFVLALSGSRSLRAEKLTDLINLNSGRNTAEVGITFSDGTKVRRRIKRTSHGYYSYNYLNDRLCKQTEVLDFLSNQGIKPHGYNVVMQGDITRIIEMSDFDRRKIVDEIAGVAEFDQKRDQALSELEVVRERIEREELLLHELNKRLVELAAEREQALVYREWQEKLAFLQACRAAAELAEKEKELAATTRLIVDQATALERIGSDRSIEENELSYLRADLRDIDDQIHRKSGPEYLRMIAELEEAKSNIRVAEGTIQRLKREKESNLEEINRSYTDYKRAEERIGECNEAVRALSIDRANLGMEAATARAKIERSEQEIKRQSREAEGARDLLFARMKDLEEKRGERSAVLREQDLLLEKSRMRTSERERLEERLRAIEAEVSTRGTGRDEAARRIAGYQEQFKTLEREIAASEAEAFAKRSALDRVRTEMRGHEQEIVRLEAMAQARGEAGKKVVDAVLGMDGVHGTIAQLAKARPEYSTALNVAAGSKIDYVVVRDDEVAASAIRYLKEERLGRLTFLPLTRLRPPPLPPVSEEGVIDYAVNLLSFDPAYTDALRVVLGQTVVVDTLERARKKMGKYRMVTPEGELIERSGAMTGGSIKRTGRGFGAAVTDEVERVRAALSSLAEEASDLEGAVARSTAVIDTKRSERDRISREIEREGMVGDEAGRQKGLLDSEREQVASALAAIAGEVTAASAGLSALEQSLDRMTEAIAGVTAEIENLKKQLEHTEIPAISEQLERLKHESEEIERRIRNKDADITDLQRERQHFTKRLEELAGDRERFTEKNKQADRDVVSANEEVAKSKARITEIEETQKEFSAEMERLRKSHDEKMAAILESERRMLEFDAQRSAMETQISALRERENRLTEEAGRMREQVGEVTTTLPLLEIDDGIAEAGHAMRKIGAVNMLAIEEYDKVKGRIDERTGKKEVLSRERTTLIERIEAFEKMKFEAFTTAFRAIDANFREIFARLASGNGHLVLENDEDPFSGGLSFAVQPRDKAVHLLSALSGGEKSLTTLAFIFSIQQYLPAPFYAFDEVDMSLDGSNVERIATMIRELASRSQFIIVSLRKPMIEGADRIMGVTLRPDKSSYVTGLTIHE